MTNYVINIDKLKLIFNNKNTSFIDKKDFKIISLPINNYSRTHKENILITYKDIDFIYLSHKDNLRPDYSKIYIVNRFLYTPFFNDILNLFLLTYDITEYKVSDIEIAINTNKQLTRNYYIHFKKNKITFNKDYKSYSFLPSERRFDNIVNNDTIYIKKDKSPINIRIENKTKEIKEHSKKQYILDYYSYIGLDIQKDIYRLEIRLNLIELRRKSRYTKFQNRLHFDDIISVREHSKFDYMTQSKYDKITLYNPYEIDIHRLDDKVYLTELFNTFTPFNYSILIQPLTSSQIKFENDFYKTKQQRTSSIRNSSLESSIISLSDDFDKLFD